MKELIDLIWLTSAPKFTVNLLLWLLIIYMCWQIHLEITLWRFDRTQKSLHKRARFG